MILRILLALLLMSMPLAAQSLDPEALDRAVEEAIAEGQTAGAVLLVGRGEEVLYHRAYGERQAGQTMTTDTVFDLASLTKPMATASAVMWLVQEGKLKLDTRISEHLPEVDPRLTVEQLLLHRGGLVPDNPLSDYEGTQEEMWARILSSPPQVEPGSEFGYTDVGYLMLGRLVEKVDGRSLDQLCFDEIWRPLGMYHTQFGVDPAIDVAASYERPLGVVHDPRAYKLGGVAGHAGLFGHAADVARFCRLLIGDLKGPLRPETLRLMLEPHHGRTYGLDADTRFSSARGGRFSPQSSCGHTGFTGCSFWVDREHGIYVVLMTNRLHPDNQGNVVPLRYQVATLVANQLLGPAVKTGVDVLVEEEFATLRGLKVGLITNHTGLDRRGRRTVDLLSEAQVELVRLFSPEHGLAGKKDSRVEDTVDQTTGLKVHSLYGESRRPDPRALEGLDILVFDIQDAGCRFYTYISTMLYALEEAEKQGVRFLVLDRPNPLGGERVEGWVSTEERRDFIACWPLPLVHGMTVGELARFFNAHAEVVKMKGWRRSMTFLETGLPWVNPSPNLRSLKQAHLYPAVGLLEWAHLSVGRGTEEPFERFGAPWIEDERALAEGLNQLELPGVRFVPLRFTPESSVFADQNCGGVHVILEDREAFPSAVAGVRIASYLERRYPTHFQAEKMERHFANDQVLEALHTTGPEEWQPALDEFLKSRTLLYK